MDDDLQAWRVFAKRPESDPSLINFVIVGNSKAGKFMLAQALSVESLEIGKPDRHGQRMFQPTNSAITYRLLSLKPGVLGRLEKSLRAGELQTENAIGLILVEQRYTPTHSRVVELLRAFSVNVCVVFSKSDMTYARLTTGKLPIPLTPSELVEVVHRDTDMIMPAGVRSFVISSIELYRAHLDPKDKCQFEEISFLKWLRYRCERDLRANPLLDIDPARTSTSSTALIAASEQASRHGKPRRRLFGGLRSSTTPKHERPRSYMYFQTRDPISGVAPFEKNRVTPGYLPLPSDLAQKGPTERLTSINTVAGATRKTSEEVSERLRRWRREVKVDPLLRSDSDGQRSRSSGDERPGVSHFLASDPLNVGPAIVGTFARQPKGKMAYKYSEDGDGSDDYRPSPRAAPQGRNRTGKSIGDDSELSSISYDEERRERWRQQKTIEEGVHQPQEPRSGSTAYFGSQPSPEDSTALNTHISY